MKKEDVQALFKEYERQAAQEAREIAATRRDAQGILKPDVLRRRVNKNQGIVLAYGMMGQVSYSPDDLKRFLNALDSFQKQPHLTTHGVPYSKLFHASRAVDIERSKTVRNAILYQRKGNIIYFQVSGNSRPHYRVMIRLEDWDTYIANATPVFKAVHEIVHGHISFECPCGRHQYWYRYMATLGHYAIKPLETGFPKIRNPGLFGCCCKHVLKVLKDLATNRVMFVLCKELEKERKKPGFSGNRPARVLSNMDLRISQAKRLTSDAAAAFQKYKDEAAQLEKKLKPKGASLNVSKKTINELKLVLSVARASKGIEKQMLNGFAKTHNMTRAQVDEIIRNNNL